jgi:quercetin dioxygenase-like cupin family protein
MQVFDSQDMEKGWFVGDFFPAAYKTTACEVAVKSYLKGEVEDMHYHQVATEVTLILSGRVIMFERVFEAGSIIVIQPNEATAFEALDDAVTVVVKVPGAKDDKYISAV